MRATVGESFAHALAAKDGAKMRELLSDDIDFQALTPGRHWRASTPENAVDDIILGVWFGPQDDVHELRSVTCGQVSDRERVTYRLGVRRNNKEYVVEQQAYYESDGTRITWIRMLCSGYRPQCLEELGEVVGGRPGRVGDHAHNSYSSTVGAGGQMSPLVRSRSAMQE